MARNIVQLNNRYIQDENQHRRYLEQERRKKNRFMGWVLILVILLFILPTFNLVQSYRNLLERRTQLMHLQKRYEEISNEKESQKAFANKLKDEESWWEKRHEKFEEMIEEQEKEALKRTQTHRAQAQEIFLQSQLESQQRLQSFFMEKMQSEQGAVNMSAFQSASVSASAVSAYEDTISTFSKSVIESQKL